LSVDLLNGPITIRNRNSGFALIGRSRQNPQLRLRFHAVGYVYGHGDEITPPVRKTSEGAGLKIPHANGAVFCFYLANAARLALFDGVEILNFCADGAVISR
jgi:hypothetical protein